ncbi:MAG: hypothetical protein GQ583_03980 [Methyloprofundus sp.]|nr:hypothetical protein [Methyloprofundus sp.]
MAWVLTGCSITQVAPIQLSRIHQTETYIQKLSFLDNFTVESIVDPGQRMSAQTLEMDKIFKQLLGKRNWQNLKDSYGLGNLRNELLENNIYIQGITNLSVYLDAFDSDYFSIEGSGRFFLIRKKTGAILLVGDYTISDKVYSIQDLERGYLIFDVKTIISRIPGQVTYYHEAPLKYKIYIDNSLGENGVYSIDYGKKHQAYLVEDDEILSKASFFASLIFKTPKRATKLFDFRGINFIRRDYQQLMKGSR